MRKIPFKLFLEPACLRFQRVSFYNHPLTAHPLGQRFLLVKDFAAKFLVLFLFILPAMAFARQEAWIKVESGAVLYLSPYDSEWIPVSEKQKIPIKTYLLTKTGARATIFKETTGYELPSAAYFFGEDLFYKNRVEIVAALTRIEAEQLPVNTSEPGQENSKTLGLTYGEVKEEAGKFKSIPHEQERYRAVKWFMKNGQNDAALLSLKRTMTKFPALYLKLHYVEQLFSLYHLLELNGFLLEESKRLLAIRQSEAFRKTVRNWHEVAKKELVQAGR